MGRTNKYIFSLVALVVFAIIVLVRGHYVQNNVEYTYSVPQPYSTSPAPLFNSLAEHVLEGDTDAYDDLCYYYSVQGPEPGGTLCYDFLMANKYQKAEACYNVYSGLYYEFYSTATIIDEETDSLIVFYLRKGAAEGDLLSIAQLGEHYLMGDIVQRDFSFGKELYRSIYPHASEKKIKEIQSRGEK